MDDDNNALSLSLPMRSGQTKLDLRPSAIRRWSRNLPLANLGWTSGSLYETLKLANGTPLPPDQRLELLELMRPTFCYVLLRLRKHYAFHQYPVPARNLEVRRFVSALLSEVITGYRLVIDGLTSARRASRPRLALALQRATRCVSGQLIESFRLYEAAPTGVWRSLHELYRVAQAQSVEHVRVRDDGLTSRGRCSVAQAYKQVLLLAAMEPGQLRQQELDGVFGALKPIAAISELQRGGGSQARTHAFLVRPDEDDGPSRHAGPPPTADVLWLDCSRFIALGMLPAPARHGWRPARRRRRPTSPHMLRRIQRALARSPQPRGQRMSSDERLEAVFGLGRISRMLAEQQQLLADTVEAVAEIAEDGEWVFDEASGRWKKEVPRVAADEAETSAETMPPQYPARDMQVVDTSTKGYALRLDDHRPQAVRVGEAIALRRSGIGRPNDPSGWQIGFIQWMQREREALRLGVELLAFQPMPVMIREKSSSAADKPVHGLRLPAVPALSRPSTLLAPHLNLQAGYRLVIDEAGAETEILLGAELARTGSCQHFDYERVCVDEPAVEREEAAPEPDFQALYATI